MPPNSRHRSHHPERSAAKDSAVLEKRPSSRVISDRSSLAGKKSKGKEVDGLGKKVLDKNSERVRVPVVDCKDRSSQKRKTAEKGGKAERVKHGPEKDAGRKEISAQCKDGKERDRERQSEMSKAERVGVSGKERGTGKGGSEVKQAKKSTGMSEKDRGPEKGVSQVKHEKKKDREGTECHIQNELHNPQMDTELDRRPKRRDISVDKDKRQEDVRESDDRRHRESNLQLNKELDRRAKRRDISDDKDKRQEDVRESEDTQYRESDGKRLSSSDDRRRSGYFRDGRHSRDKPSDIDHRYLHDDRYYDEHPSRKRAYEHIEEDKFTKSHKKTKLLDRDHDGGPYEVRTDFRGQRDRKRPYDEYEDHRDLRLQGRKHPRVDVDVDSHIMEDKFIGRNLKKSKLKGSDNYDDQFIEEDRKICRDNIGRKRSPEGDDYHRDMRFRDKKQPCRDVEASAPGTTRSRLNQGESTQRMERSSQEKYYSSSASRGDSSGFCRREQKDHTAGSVRETVVDQKYDMTSGSDSPAKYDIDLVRSKQNGGRGGNTIPVSSSFSSRGGYSSPCGCPPRPMKRQIDICADMGSFEQDNTFQSVDHSTGMSQGNAWRSASLWPPNTNFLVPIQHCSPPPFQPALEQFPIPFGISQPMNMNPTGIYPFGYGHVDVTTQFQHWGGYNNLAPWNPHNYSLANQNQMINGGWERNPTIWNGQNNNDNMDPVPQETEYTTKPLVHDDFDVKSNHGSQSEQALPESVPDEKIEAKHSDISSGKHTDETLLNNISKKTTQPKICHVKSYLSKLDISSNLVPPELYNRCLIMLEPKDADSETNSKQVKEATKATSKTSNHLSSLFPKTKDAIFERTVSLCKKQNEVRSLKLPVPDVLLKDDSNSPEASNIQEAKENFSKQVSQETSDSRIVKPLAGQTSGEMLDASADQASGDMLEASNAEIVKPLTDPASEEISEASKAEMVKPLANLDTSNVCIVKPLTDQDSPEILEVSSADAVKSLVHKILGEMSEAATDSDDDLYIDLEVAFSDEVMEPPSDVTSGATIIAENHSQGTMSLHKKQCEPNSLKSQVTSILPQQTVSSFL